MTSIEYWTRKIIEVLESPSENFGELVQISGLDPTEDFKNRDLSGVDFSGSNLEFFDFTGSNLQGVRFHGARISKSRFDTEQLKLRELRTAEDFDHLVDFYSLTAGQSWELEDFVPDATNWTEKLRKSLGNLVKLDAGDVLDRRELYWDGYVQKETYWEGHTSPGTKEKDGDIRISEPIDLSVSLMKLVKDRDIRSVKMLLNAGLNANEADPITKEFPIFAAIENKQKSMIRLLAQSGARIDLVSPKTGMSAIHTACESESASIVSALLGGEGDVNTLSPAKGVTALMAAASLGNLSITRILIDAGADIHKQSTDGKTALMHAVDSRRKNVVRLLLQIDRSVISATDNDGADCLSLASDLGFDDIFDILNSYETGSR